MASRVQVSVVVPTYCEAQNLPPLAQRVAQALHRQGRSFEILIIDDNSPDETARVCLTLAKKHPLRLIVRKDQRGLSSAVVRGLDAASGEVLVVMDADLSHPPERIPDLVALVEHPEIDFAIGSRYVPGGTTAEDWGLLRQLNSRVATWLARGLTTARDPLAGFFALPQSTYQRARGQLNAIGYKIGLELMVKAGCRNVVEIPIHFANRHRGSSKLGIQQQIQYLHHLIRLYRYRYTAGAAAAAELPGQESGRRAA